MYFNIKNTHNRHQQGYEIYKEKDKSAPNQEANHKKLSKQQDEEILNTCVVSFHSQRTVDTIKISYSEN